MPDTPADPPGTGPIDAEVLDRVAAHLVRSARFDDVRSRPTYAPNAVVADYDLGYFPREHFHPPPDTPTPGEDENYPDEWRDVLASVLTRLDERVEAFWKE